MALADVNQAALNVTTFAIKTNDYATLVQLEEAQLSSYSTITAKKPWFAPKTKSKKALVSKCRFHNSTLSDGRGAVVRYCSRPISDGSKLYTTVFKVDLEKSDTHLFEVFQGISLETTATLAERFLASIKVEDDKL